MLRARAAKEETFETADDRPSSGKLAAMIMSFLGSPTDRSGMGIEYLTGTKLTVPFSWNVAFLFSRISLKRIFNYLINIS